MKKFNFRIIAIITIIAANLIPVIFCLTALIEFIRLVEIRETLMAISFASLWLAMSISIVAMNKFLYNKLWNSAKVLDKEGTLD